MTKVMASVTSPTSQSGSIRRRGGSIKETSSEDQALNMIAKEAEARLAAKRAARAEARSIRMKEIEKKQNEVGDEGGLSNDTSPLKENKYLLTRAATLHGDEHLTMLRREEHVISANIIPAYDVIDSVSNDAQTLQLKETIRLGEEKYKKAMVNSAQLDNERQALQYQVEVLKDIIEELQQRVENTDDELLHKSREHNKLTREHNVTSTELNKSLFLIEERERILDEHGINVDGTIKEGYSSPTSTGQCTLCSASLNDDLDAVDSPSGRESLLAEIASLKSEINGLKQINNSKQLNQDVKLRNSSSNISDEDADFHDDVLHAELYVDNNKNNENVKSFGIPFLKLSTDTVENMDSIPGDDIANIEDCTKSTLKINVDSYTNVDYTPSISPSGSVASASNINVFNYLGGDDHDDTLNDDSGHYTSFRVSRYFDTETSSSVDTNTANDNHELETSVGSYTANDVHRVQSSPQKAVEEIVTIESAQIEMSSPDDFIENFDSVFDTDQKTNEVTPNISTDDSEVNLYYQIKTCQGVENDSTPDTTPDSSMNTAFCEENDNTNHKLPIKQNESITQIIRNDVEELYNQIAGETNDEIETSDDRPEYELFNPALPMSALPSGGEHKGWKVWLESSIAQKPKQAENKVLNTAEPTDDSNDPAPEAKERKKKKKKKKK